MTNPFGRSAVEQREYERHHYPGTDVLVNALDIRDPVILEATERSLVAKRYQQGLPEAALTIDSPGLQAIHGHLFQDIYAWAGEFRRYTTGRGAAPFAPPEQIRPWLDQQFEDLKAERYLNNMHAAHFADRAAHYVNELNAAHPFIEGNGRVQRVWLRNLAEQAGHHVRLRSEDRERWYEASRIGFEKADSGPMADLIRGALVKTNDRTDAGGDEFTRSDRPRGSRMKG